MTSYDHETSVRSTLMKQGTSGGAVVIKNNFSTSSPLPATTEKKIVQHHVSEMCYCKRVHLMKVSRGPRSVSGSTTSAISLRHVTPRVKGGTCPRENVGEWCVGVFINATVGLEAPR